MSHSSGSSSSVWDFHRAYVVCARPLCFASFGAECSSLLGVGGLQRLPSTSEACRAMLPLLDCLQIDGVSHPDWDQPVALLHVSLILLTFEVQSCGIRPMQQWKYGAFQCPLLLWIPLELVLMATLRSREGKSTEPLWWEEQEHHRAIKEWVRSGSGVPSPGGGGSRLISPEGFWS